MSISRRHLLRLLRLRNLLMFTLIVILLYMVKLLSNMEAENQFANQALEMFQVPETNGLQRDYFIPTTLKVS